MQLKCHCYAFLRSYHLFDGIFGVLKQYTAVFSVFILPYMELLNYVQARS